MKAYKYILIILVLAVVAQASLAKSQIYRVDYNNTPSNSNNANLVVQVLKYEPYPVNAGDWFDLWIKVQNIGQNDAINTRFELQPEYPFTSNDTLVKDYGLIYGTQDAFKVDGTYDSSQVILKYRVKVADNAPEGTSNLNFVTTTNKDDPNSISIVNSLPISIGKTKTDFDVVMQQSSGQGSSFAISNIGSNTAAAITVTLLPSPGLIIQGSPSNIIGNLNAGDFTTTTFSLSALNSTRNITRTNFPSNGNFKTPNQVTMQISYTDTAGIRNTIEKNITLAGLGTSSFGASRTVSTTSSSSKYIYLVIGIIAGFLIVFIYRKIKKKK